MTVTVADLTARTGQRVYDHVPLGLDIPIIDGPQAQGDVFVLPAAWVPGALPWVGASGRGAEDVPAGGVELLRGTHPHTLVADPGTCQIVRAGLPALVLAVIDCTAPVWLLHPEHGGTGIAPGRWVIRRQREMGDEIRAVAD